MSELTATLKRKVDALPVGGTMPHPRYPGIVIRKKKTGVSYDVRFTHEGRKSSRSFPKLDQARGFLVERDRIRIHQRTGIDLERGSQTLTAHINDWWETYAKTHHEDSTRETNRRCIQTHIVPALGHLQLRQITPDVIYGFLVLLQQRTGAAQVQRTMSVLSGILKRAVERGLIDANPVRDISVPTAKRVGVIRPFELSQVEAIRKALWDHPAERLYVSLIAYAGLRPAEARALRAGSIRWAAGSIDIEGRGGGDERRSGNKAEGGRTMRMLNALRDDLRDAGAHELPDAQEILRGPSGRPWTASMHKKFVSGRWRRTLQSLDLPVQRLYILRHTHASLRIYEQRWTATEIARMMGHDEKTLFQYYSHILLEAADAGPLDLERAIRAARDTAGTHPPGAVLDELRPAQLVIRAIDPYGSSTPDRFRRLLLDAGLTDIDVEVIDIVQAREATP